MAVLPYTPVILKLLQDVLYSDDRFWSLLLQYQREVKLHFESLGLQLWVDELEGYAYLTQPAGEDEGETAGNLPRLVRRTRLTYDQTLLCVLLREELQRFDTQRPDEARLVLRKTDIYELLRLFYPEQNDMTRLAGRLDKIIKQVVELGFLKLLPNSTEELYEVRRIIKAKISADKLAEIKEKLQAVVLQEEI